MNDTVFERQDWRWGAPLLLIVVPLLLLLGLTRFTIFHTMIELATVVVALLAFLAVWTSRDTLADGFALLLGVSYFFTGTLDFLHALSYSGFAVLPSDAGDIPTQLWVAGRLMEAGSLVLAFTLLTRRPMPSAVFWGYGALTGLIVLSIYYWDIFPTAYVQGSGLTAFKVSAEIVVIALLLLAGTLLIANRDRFPARVSAYLGLAIGLTIASEIMFVSYVGVFDAVNAVGHIFKLLSYMALLRGVVETAVVRPQELHLRAISEATGDLESQIHAGREERAVLVAALERLNALVIRADGQGRVLWANDAARRALGSDSPDDPAWVMDVIEGMGPSQWTDLMERLGGGGPITQDRLLVDRSGNAAHVELRIERVNLDAGGAPVIWVLATDITERKAAEAAAARMRLRFRAVIDSAPDIVLVHDESGRILDVNRACVHMLGYQRDELIGMTIGAIEMRWRANRGPTGFFDGVTQETPAKVEGIHRRKDGSRFPVEVTIGRLGQDDPTVAGPIFVAIARDMTERNAQIEQTRAAAEAAQAASRAKTEFLANVGHELRTPLNAVMGFAEIMQGELLGPLPQRYQAYAADILSSARRLMTTLNDILDMSRMEAGTWALSEESVDLGSVAASCVVVHQKQADSRGVALVNRVPCDRYILKADRPAIRQVLMNLVSNAVTFSRAGDSVTLAAVPPGADGEPEANELVLTVRDTGIGMSAEAVEKALLPFEQVDGALTRQHEGLGLGLPLAKALVELHGGRLQIDSALDAGTTVSLIFPADRITLLPDA